MILERDWIDDVYKRMVGGGFTQRDLSDLVKIDESYVSTILRRRRAAPPALKDKILKALSVMEEAKEASDASRDEILAKHGYEV